ncbi:MAG: flippase-like domain-containing protein, partial [Duncaniella sp.]|nr:flippase-like domain-containing protein [Duncaniella sp.]
MNTADANTKPNQPSERRQVLSLVWKIFLPIAIGLGVVVWLFHREFKPEVWESIHFDSRVIGCILLAWLFMIGRDFGLTWRFRALTDHQLPWRKALKVDMLCEFTSCVTPSAVGGSALGMIYLNREGIELGRATTLMMTTLFLDELFFVISIPLIMLLVPYAELFDFGHGKFTVGLESVFWGVYAVIFIWTSILFLGIIVRPHAIHR